MAYAQYDVFIYQNSNATPGSLEYELKTFAPAANSLVGFDSSKILGNVTATVATGGISISSGALAIAPASITAECTAPNTTQDYLIISDNGVLSKISFGNLMSTAVAVVTAPTAYNSTGTAGSFAYDANYLYVCTATNTWKRAVLAGTWS